ncbi:hypothetical protein BAG01nite_04660 [Brevibacillus agri]|uniref:Uncharacterized protein n=1 Tax=Brevibacillus agri TaxID=51101 RepID=A0A3M8AZA3_9BACL|nr:hypothetical protein [Brevibacillus agri]MDN4094293.1 hypothetical protein [Brevibacillus agri]MED3496961.1 hypothetical protein [Brevibacillus agri]QAV13540.1 hypothetical protein BA6348_12710 [Brevibacillus agri]RNB56422.1 hypothetical protein EB820_09230 [Brevibacillus agri]GED24364.1 hypothetical protein BAG01nite_04660 [Brevibacillus agri]
MGSAKKKTRAKSVSRSRRRSSGQATRRLLDRLNRVVRLHVRAPNVKVTTPAPHVSVTSATPTVQVEAPIVQFEAPKPLVIPAPIVNVDVEAEDTPEQESVEGLRKELYKCMRQNRTVEVILTSDWGPGSRPYRVGQLTRVDDGIIELKLGGSYGSCILIPLNRIAAIIPDAPPPEAAAPTDEAEETAPVTLKVIEGSAKVL